MELLIITTSQHNMQFKVTALIVTAFLKLLALAVKVNFYLSVVNKTKL